MGIPCGFWRGSFMDVSARAMKSVPAITVVLSTRNRGARIVDTIETILASDGPRFEMNIVDQSDNDLTQESVQRYLIRPDVQYFRTSTRGLAAARNIGIAHARSELIALTDDDCTVTPNWLQELSEAFLMDERVAIVFGNVLACSHDRSSGFIPAYVRRGACLARSMIDKHKVEGIGACMALRRSVWSELGGFDEMLGAGGRFRSAEELDFAIRTLQASHSIYETDRVEVIHHGFRTTTEKHDLIYGHLYGIGAVFIKHLKCRRWSILTLLCQLALRWAFGSPIVDFGEPPSRKLRLKGFVDGFVAGAVTPVNQGKALYARLKEIST
jgi:glycosyltransferase involved in cell wall biosynthesis